MLRYVCDQEDIQINEIEKLTIKKYKQNIRNALDIGKRKAVVGNQIFTHEGHGDRYPFFFLISSTLPLVAIFPLIS